MAQSEFVKSQIKKVREEYEAVSILIDNMKAQISFISKMRYRGPLFEAEKRRYRDRIGFLNRRKKALIAKHERLMRN